MEESCDSGSQSCDGGWLAEPMAEGVRQEAVGLLSCHSLIFIY
jgi:hypothetical protein